MAELLSSAELRGGFEYPPEFVRAVEFGLVQLEPWFILTGDQLRRRFAGVQKRYPDRGYLPFAERQDSDDLACWTPPSTEVVLVHDHASPGWERPGNHTWPDFHAWLRQAVEDFIEWGEDELKDLDL